ncbi:MAG TPA: hypothetical protein VLM37_07010 [Fibrobacteraceae bacterium]|nr:hypothetical protein [Fibrobacteraceae bacterium]
MSLQTSPTALPQQISRNREFHCKMRNRQYERAHYLFRKLEGLVNDPDNFHENDQLPLLRELASCVETCLEHANAAVFFGKRSKLQPYGKDRRYGILQEEYILVHFLEEVLSSVLYTIRRIETDVSLQVFADGLEEFKGDTPHPPQNGFVDRVLESLAALKNTSAEEFRQIYGVLSQRYQIGNKLFSLIQDLQRFR